MSDRLVPPQILHVDDELEMLEQGRDYLEREQIDDWGCPVVTGITSFGDALKELEARRYDLMILDVRLGGRDGRNVPPGEEAGVRTIAEIRQRRFLPIIFWTGLPNAVRYLDGSLVRVVEKTEGLDVLLASVREFFGAGLPALNRALLRLVEDEQRSYMWDFVAHHWDELRESADHMALAHLLVRRLGRSLSGPGIERVAIEMGAASKPPAPGTVHAAEMYIVPPLPHTNPGAADLYLDNSGAWWLVVTPSCDLEHDKAEYVVLAGCEPIMRDARLQAWQANDSKANMVKVRDLVSHKTGGQNDRHLFLPAAPTIPHLITDFQRVRCVTRSELDAMGRVASLASPFAEAAISRFVRYFGRVGTDDLDVKAIMDSMKDMKDTTVLGVGGEADDGII